MENQIDNRIQSPVENQTNKGGKGKTVLIVILIVLLLGALGYIAYDKFLVKETTEPEKTEKKVEKSKENLDNIAVTLLEKINNYELDLLDVYGNNLTVSSIPTNEQLDTMYFYLAEKNNNDMETLKMTKTVVDDYFNSVYGITPTEYPNIVCKLDNVIEYIYDNTKQEYVFNHNVVAHAHGGYSKKSLTQMVTNIKNENGNYVIDVVKLYAGSMLDTSAGHYYSDGQCNNVLAEFDQFFGADTTGEYDTASAISYFQSNEDKYKNNKPQYRYTFKKDNNNYSLVSYEVIK